MGQNRSENSKTKFQAPEKLQISKSKGLGRRYEPREAGFWPGVTTGGWLVWGEGGGDCSILGWFWRWYQLYSLAKTGRSVPSSVRSMNAIKPPMATGRRWAQRQLTSERSMAKRNRS